MKTLNDIIEENGIEALRNLLSKELEITEKINGHRLVAKKKINGKVDFFTKKSKQPIGIIDNVMCDLYADAIGHILKYKDRLPIGETSFYLVKNDLDVIYTSVQAQSLLLTNTLNRQGLSVNDIAERMGVRCQPTVFRGVLSDSNIENIVNYIYNGGVLPVIFDEMFGKSSYALNESANDIVEGYIFSIDGVLYKLEDTRVEKKEFKKINTSNYEILVNDVIDFFSEKYIDNLNLFQTKVEFRYIEIISHMLVDFIKRNNEEELNFLTALPTFADTTGKVNVRYLANNAAKTYITENPKYEYLFRVLLQLFRRDLATRGLITDETCGKHKLLRNKIDDRSSKIGMPTFEESIKLKR